MQYTEIPPDPRLAGIVSCYWTLDGDGTPEASPAPILPDGHMELVFHYGDPFRRQIAEGRHEVQSRALLAGQMTRPVHLIPSDRAGVIGARFRPGGLYAVVHHPQHLFTDAIVPLEDVARDLVSEIAPRIEDAVDNAARVAVLERALLRRTCDVRDRGPVPSAVTTILASGGTVSIERVAASCGVSSRHLERAFRDQVGLSPKMLARVIRFQNVFQAVETGRLTTGVMLALSCGYYDQAHFVRDFKAFAGDTPASFLANPPALSAFFTRGTHRVRSQGIDA